MYDSDFVRLDGVYYSFFNNAPINVMSHLPHQSEVGIRVGI